MHIGWNPLAGGTPIIGTMIQEKLFEKEAQKLGYEVTAAWQQFPGGAPMANAAMVAGRLDIDVDFAVGAIVPRIKNKVPIVIFGIHASHLSNAVVVRPGSDINEVSKLAGKTVGLPIATSAHYTLATIVKYQTGKTLQEMNIKLVNMVPSEGIKMPQGIDAAGVWVPLRFMGKPLGTAELLVDSSAFNGAAHRQPNQRAADAANGLGLPGRLPDRPALSLRARRLRQGASRPAGRVSARRASRRSDSPSPISPRRWRSPTNGGSSIRRSPRRRATPIRRTPTSATRRTSWSSMRCGIIKGSEFFASIGTIDGPVTWDELKPVLMPAAEMQKRAWEAGGSKPSVAEMEAGFKGSNPTWPQLTIAGGRPVWMWEQTPKWGERHYKAGPFPATK